MQNRFLERRSHRLLSRGAPGSRRDRVCGSQRSGVIKELFGNKRFVGIATLHPLSRAKSIVFR